MNLKCKVVVEETRPIEVARPLHGAVEEVEPHEIIIAVIKVLLPCPLTFHHV
jgi:hypothetical protein